ncbi:MAG TPA: hypothetical protein VN867_01315 [Candidatus Binataceae bacterium]|nr:hypothetical protein [Candidatus Binataceae bacterium]
MAATEQSKQNGHSHAGESRASHRPRRDESASKDDLTEIIKAQPIVCLAIAGAAGFIVGGGARSPGGIAILAALARVAAREALGDSSALDDFMPEKMGKEL